METHKNIPAIYAKNRNAWRRWLQKHHDTEKAVWLILHNKGSETPSVNYADAVEEALCYGWIDGLVNKRDAHSRYQYYTRRKPKSNWSAPNRERVARMTAEGKMTPAGQAMIDLAKQTGTWDATATAEKAEVPADLQQLLNKNKKAKLHFDAFPPSSKRVILEWLINAKRPETREKRLRETVALAAQNIRANHPKPQGS